MPTWARRDARDIELDISDGRARAGLDRPDFYRRAAGSANELATALRIAQVRGFIAFTAVDAALDRVRAMSWRLTH